jgi:hypothetical protein
MCGPADFSALGLSLVRLTALAVAGGGFMAATRIVRMIEDMRKRTALETEDNHSANRAEG